MKNQTARTFFLLGIALILFAASGLFLQAGTYRDICNGASAGFGLAGSISFIMLLVQNYKNRKA